MQRRVSVLLVSASVLALLTGLLANSQALAPSAVQAGSLAVTATPEPTAEWGDLSLSGLVYDQQSGPGAPIAGARVAAVLCVPRTYQATTGADGRYLLAVPGLYASACSELTMEVSAPGYEPLSQVCSVNGLRTRPERDWALAPVATATSTAPAHSVHLPPVLSGG